MFGDTPIVSIVDDDAAVLRSLARLLRASGFAVRTFPSPQAFLEQPDDGSCGCVLIDLSMPGLNGLQLQQALVDSGRASGIVFITGHGDIASSVQAMKAGAVDFLTKPFEDERLLDAVRSAIAKDSAARAARAGRAATALRLSALTPREREVLDHVVAGRLNKQIAADLGTAEKTIKVHRARVLEKMGARSLAELVRLVVTSAPPPPARGF